VDKHGQVPSFESIQLRVDRIREMKAKLQAEGKEDVLIAKYGDIETDTSTQFFNKFGGNFMK
jgi:hypothetical protein